MTESSFPNCRCSSNLSVAEMIPKVLLAVKLDPLLDRDEADLAMEPGPPATAPA